MISKHNLTSDIAVPLAKASNIFGAIVLFTSGEGLFAYKDIEFLQALSCPLASSFEAHFYVWQIYDERKKLWAILENLAAGVLIIDGSDTVKNCNRTALQMMGLEQGMLLGKPVADSLLPNILNARNEEVYRRFDDIA